MEVKDKLKSIAEDYGWRFVYARRDYQNLHEAAVFITDEMVDAGEGETVLFLDPVVRDPKSDGMKYSGNFMVLTKSDLDLSYDDRTLRIIDPLVQKVMHEMRAKLLCIYDVDLWKSIEVINVFDFNADGLSVNFDLKAY